MKIQAICPICNSLHDFEENSGTLICSSCNHSFLRCSTEGCSQLIYSNSHKFNKQQKSKEVLCKYCLSQKRRENPLPNRIKSVLATVVGLALVIVLLPKKKE